MKKVIIVTGGTRGIGAAIARLAAVKGYAVCISCRHNQCAAEAVVASICEKNGTATAVQADVAVAQDVVRRFERVDSTLGPVTALVHNAGILEQQACVDDMDAERITRIFATNAVGSFLGAREAVRRMSTRHGGLRGAIVNISSRASRLGAPDEYVDYAASKAAIDTLTIGLAKEVAAQGMRVNTVSPGVIYTDIHASGGEPQRVERIKDSIPMKRGGKPKKWPRSCSGCCLKTRLRPRGRRLMCLVAGKFLPDWNHP